MFKIPYAFIGLSWIGLPTVQMFPGLSRSPIPTPSIIYGLSLSLAMSDNVALTYCIVHYCMCMPKYVPVLLICSCASLVGTYAFGTTIIHIHLNFEMISLQSTSVTKQSNG